MRVVFVGTPAAAVPSLRAVHEAFETAAVYTRPDRPRGRGRHVSPSPVKEEAVALGLRVEQPTSLRKEAERLTEIAPDVIAVVAYGMILPKSVLDVPKLGCVNVHFSLLPRWRGAAPVERAIAAGDVKTGVCTMLMDEGMDTGPVLMRAEVPIAEHDTTGTVTGLLAIIGGGLLVRTLVALEDGTITPQPQPDKGAVLAPKISVEEAELDPGRPAVELWRKVRAFDPAPGAYTWIDGRRVKVWRATVGPGEGEPGRVAAVGDESIDVQTSAGRLHVLELQAEGKRRMRASDFLRGHRVQPGAAVGRPAGQ